MRKARRLCGCAVLAGLALLASGPSSKGQDLLAGQPVLGFKQEARVRAAMQLFAAPNPMALAAVRIMAVSPGNSEAPLLGPDWELELTAPIPLPHAILEKLKDGMPVPDKGKPVNKLRDDELAYWLIQDYALIDCTLVPPELFKKAGEANGHVTFDHLYASPKQYRGEVVRVEGRLLRVRKWRPSEAAQKKGVEWVYEGFIAGQTPHRPPYIVLFTTLPQGVPVRETLSVPVIFYGYFIKKLDYPAEKVRRVTNLLIGPTLYVDESAVVVTPPTPPFSRDVMYATIGGLFAIAVAILTMHWWFRRGDQAIHSRLARLKDRGAQPFADDPPAPNGN